MNERIIFAWYRSSARERVLQQGIVLCCLFHAAVWCDYITSAKLLLRAAPTLPHGLCVLRPAGSYSAFIACGCEASTIPAVRSPTTRRGRIRALPVPEDPRLSPSHAWNPPRNESSLPTCPPSWSARSPSNGPRNPNPQTSHFPASGSWNQSRSFSNSLAWKPDGSRSFLH